jgi:hypothetical protein
MPRGRWIATWEPDDEDFWQRRGRSVARVAAFVASAWPAWG